MSNTDERLKSYVDRIEKLDDEAKEIASAKKDIRQEAKSAGFDPRILALVLRRRKLDRAEVEEQDAMLERYEAALGLL